MQLSPPALSRLGNGWKRENQSHLKTNCLEQGRLTRSGCLKAKVFASSTGPCPTLSVAGVSSASISIDFSTCNQHRRQREQGREPRAWAAHRPQGTCVLKIYRTDKIPHVECVKGLLHQEENP
ncbi:hypothetical protein BaRGS_00003833 [Batillaria attramentaria]|uniref:Uncharacterized protein n=1 Tax=Batillaria attramentaria TaxID=370345 RepID=A0ABD0LZ34_9CAEN